MKNFVLDDKNGVYSASDTLAVFGLEGLKNFLCSHVGCSNGITQ